MDVAVELDVLVVVLGDYHLVDLGLVVIILQDLIVGGLEGLVVFGDALEVVDGQLGDLAVFFVLLEEGLEGIVAEEGDFHEVFEALD